MAEGSQSEINRPQMEEGKGKIIKHIAYSCWGKSKPPLKEQRHQKSAFNTPGMEVVRTRSSEIITHPTADVV